MLAFVGVDGGQHGQAFQHGALAERIGRGGGDGAAGQFGGQLVLAAGPGDHRPDGPRQGE